MPLNACFSYFRLFSLLFQQLFEIMWIALHLRQLEIKNMEVRMFSSHLDDTSQLITNYVNVCKVGELHFHWTLYL